MLNRVLSFLRAYEMVQPGDTVICAVSGGADSVALLGAMELLREKLDIRLEAAHFNHRLRGAESDRDEAFVRRLCAERGIPLHVGSGTILPGPKGLEAAAREARYAFFETLTGKIATAHTADDNAETVLLHLTRGTGLKGLGAIAPVRGRYIRPMLTVTRREVLPFLREQGLDHVEDSTNSGEDFLRNRIRRRVMPLLLEENPSLVRALSQTALDLREEEAVLSAQALICRTDRVEALRGLPPALRRRVLALLLQEWGVAEPERAHIALAEELIFSDRPSAQARFPGGVTLRREYDRLVPGPREKAMEPVLLPERGRVRLETLGLAVDCTPAETVLNTPHAFTVRPAGQMVLRPRAPGDTLRLPGGRKSLKKLFIDRKIPAARRMAIPVLADDLGVLGVWGVGANLDRLGAGTLVTFTEETSTD